MTTTTLPPWDNNPDWVSQTLTDFHTLFKEKIEAGVITLPSQKQMKGVDEFFWREYFVIASVLLASRSKAAATSFVMIEAGVCDGKTGWFANKTATVLFPDYEYWAYDSWEAMRSEELLPSEMGLIGLYDWLDLGIVRSNLKEFGHRVRFCQGFLPGSLIEHEGPPCVHWLHIDLNAAVPSEKTLSHFWHRIPDGGVVLLDDYNWGGYEDMKVLVDNFLKSQDNWVIALPTGQGLVIKS